MSDNWVVQNLENALEVWNGKLSELWQILTQSPETLLSWLFGVETDAPAAEGKGSGGFEAKACSGCLSGIRYSLRAAYRNADKYFGRTRLSDVACEIREWSDTTAKGETEGTVATYAEKSGYDSRRFPTNRWASPTFDPAAKRIRHIG